LAHSSRSAIIKVTAFQAWGLRARNARNVSAGIACAVRAEQVVTVADLVSRPSTASSPTMSPAALIPRMVSMPLSDVAVTLTQADRARRVGLNR